MDEALKAERLRVLLVDTLGADCVFVDPSQTSAHAGDWSDVPKMAPSLVVAPREPAQVARALAILSEAGQRVVVQGGLTGLAGGSTPRAGEVALSLAKLTAVESFDKVGGTITVQAGLTLEMLQDYVEAHGWMFPLDLGARGSCQIGGNASTNAGGNRVVRFGTMRERVLGLEVALTDGTLLSMMHRVTKNTTGIDLKQLFIGSEGTLGVITRLVLKLEPLPTAANTALCALSSFDDAARLFKHLKGRLPALSSFELMWDNFIAAGCDVLQRKQPFSEEWPVYALVETLGVSEGDEHRALELALAAALEDGLVADVIVAQSLDQISQLWSYREAIVELLTQMKPHAAFDIGIPTDRMAEFVESTRQSLGKSFPSQRHLFFGHLGDGNLHVLSGPFDDVAAIHQVEEVVYRAVRDVGGSISAEHGIGLVKRPFLHMSRSSGELQLMQSLKNLLDPSGVLNAGRVFAGLDG